MSLYDNSTPTSSVMAAALEYQRRGWSLLPVGRDKRPRVKSWARFQNAAPTESEVRDWFKDESNNVAIILGRVSGGLAVRDFDAEGAYDRWAIVHPELAKCLPTASTGGHNGNGRHVYFVTRTDQRTVVSSDGELRADGSYAVAAPSRHASGRQYTWLIPPGDEIPIVDPLAAGLLYTEKVQMTLVSKSLSPLCTFSVYDSGVPDDKVAFPEWLAPSLHGYWSQIDDAINRTLPTKAGTRHHQVFKLARAIKAIVPESTPTHVLEPIAEDWHLRAGANVRSESHVTVNDFLNAWHHCVRAEGKDYIDEILAKAAKRPLPPEHKPYLEPRAKLLLALCRELQHVAGDAPFFLAGRTAAEKIGVPHQTAASWLSRFRRHNLLEEVTKGKMRHASRYRYRGVPL